MQYKNKLEFFTESTALLLRLLFYYYIYKNKVFKERYLFTMKISCSKGLLEKAISKTQRAVIQRSSIPALTGFLLEAYDNRLSVTGYDLEIGVTCSIESDIKVEGSCIITAKEFSDIVRSLPDDEINITVDDNHSASITCGLSEFSSIAAFDADEFPALPSVESENMLSIPKNILK